nr:uncharacterized protein LOC117690200 isoform X3 [Crassostrea gigas]
MEEWAKHFAANTLLNSLTKSTVGQPQDTCNMCAICLRDDKQVKAESWCHGCQEMICETCKDLHKIVVTLRKHKITALALKNQIEDLQFPDMDEPCRSHAGKFIEVFCLDHEKLCCSVCFAIEHRHCEHVETLEDIAKRMLKSNVDGNIEVLSKLAKVTKETIDLKEQTIREINAKKETILTNVSTEIENLKSKLDECQQQFEKTFLKTHEENEEKLVQCVLDLKRYLLTAENGQALLSAVQQKGSAKNTFITAMKTIEDIKEQFQQFKANYSGDEEFQYEHHHTTILKQVCEKDTIEHVTEIARPSGTIWNLSLHLPSFRVIESMKQKQPSTLFQNLTDPNLLKVKRMFEFPIPGSAYQGVFVDSETLIIACSSPLSLKAAKTDGTMNSFEYPIKLKGKHCLYSGPSKNVLYVSCLSSIYKLKIINTRKNATDSTCVAEFKTTETEGIDVFCVEEAHNRIIVASKGKIQIFVLSPVLNVQTIIIKSLVGNQLLSQCITHDRFVTMSENEVVCFSLSGQPIFRHQISSVKSIMCVSLDHLMNVYGGCSSRQGCGGFDDSMSTRNVYTNYKPMYRSKSPIATAFPCDKCGFLQHAHIDSYSVFQIVSDGSKSRLLISDYPKPNIHFF